MILGEPRLRHLLQPLRVSRQQPRMTIGESTRRRGKELAEVPAVAAEAATFESDHCPRAALARRKRIE
jgi:hypothetical protein